LDIQYYFTNMNIKIWISKKIYPNVSTLTKPANVSSFINGIKKLLDENITFVDCGDESVTECEVMQTGIVDSKYDTQKNKSSCRYLKFFFISGRESLKCIKINNLPLKSNLEKYKPYFNYSHKC
jgi:hypothetical protein